MNIALESLGWLGAVMVLGGYALLAMKKLAANSYAYHGINILGGLLLGVYALWKGAWASILVNGVWVLIGIAAVVMLWQAGSVRRKQ